MSKEKHYIARKQLGLFFLERRKALGRSCKEIADFIGISENTMNRIESGSFDYNIMLMFKICESLAIKPFFVLKEMENKFTDNIFGTNLN